MRSAKTVATGILSLLVVALLISLFLRTTFHEPKTTPQSASPGGDSLGLAKLRDDSAGPANPQRCVCDTSAAQVVDEGDETMASLRDLAVGADLTAIAAPAS